MAVQGVTARLTVERGRSPPATAAHVELHNGGSDAVVVDSVAVTAPSLALEIRRDDGAAFPLPPPPLPGDTGAPARIEPGDTRSFDLAGFLPSWTPPGRYTIRFKLLLPGAAPAEERTVRSEWVELIVVP
jgi:hypothetical protein